MSRFVNCISSVRCISVFAIFGGIICLFSAILWLAEYPRSSFLYSYENHWSRDRSIWVSNLTGTAEDTKVHNIIGPIVFEVNYEVVNVTEHEDHVTFQRRISYTPLEPYLLEAVFSGVMLDDKGLIGGKLLTKMTIYDFLTSVHLLSNEEFSKEENRSKFIEVEQGTWTYRKPWALSKWENASGNSVYFETEETKCIYNPQFCVSYCQRFPENLRDSEPRNYRSLMPCTPSFFQVEEYPDTTQYEHMGSNEILVLLSCQLQVSSSLSLEVLFNFYNKHFSLFAIEDKATLRDYHVADIYFSYCLDLLQTSYGIGFLIVSIIFFIIAAMSYRIRKCTHSNGGSQQHVNLRLNSI